MSHFHNWTEVPGTRYAVCDCGAVGIPRGVRMYGNNPDGAAYADGETFEPADPHQIAQILEHLQKGLEGIPEGFGVAGEYLEAVTG